MINLNPQFKYGIMLSGGLDSAVLLYLLLRADSTIDIQSFTIAKSDGSHRYVSNILRYFEDQFQITLAETIIVGDPTAHHTVQSKTAVVDILQHHKHIDYIYFATNQNPVYNFDYANGGAPNRVLASPHPKVVMPFIKMYKDEILKLAIDHGQAELFNLTHSCTEQKTGRCGQCFQCKERAWAFDQLDQTDPGIN